MVRRVVVELNGTPASYRESGAGVVAMVTAGLGLSSRFYEESYEPFARAGIRLVVPDLPGWGETPGPRTGIGPQRTAEFLLALADRIGVRRPVWIGHSLGAQVVLEIAARRPARAAGVVLVGPTGAPDRWRLARQAWGLGVEAWRTSWRVIGAVAREYVVTPPERYIGTWLRHAQDDVLARLPAVRCPALIVAGDADPVCRPDFIELLRHRLPHGEVRWVRGGTHALPRGHAAEFNRVVTSFVRRLSAASA